MSAVIAVDNSTVIGADNCGVIRTDLLRHVTVIDVTPELAETWLGRNTHNRNLKLGNIDRFANDMQVGAWQWNGSSICFATDGRLLDGQNRLHAIVRSGITVPFVIVTDLPQSAQDAIDMGISRKLSDVLTLNGEVNATTLGSILRLCAAWDAGHRGGVFNGGSYGSVADGLAFLREHPELREITEFAKSPGGSSPLSPGLLGLVYWVFGRIDTDDADAFVARLVDGQNLAKGNPIYELRRTLAERAMKTNTATNRRWTLVVTVKAWNCYRDGVEVGLYRWSPGGSRPEPFPEPR